jgi:hypothetical protein
LPEIDGFVELPSGVQEIDEPMTLLGGSSLIGHGTTLRLADGADCHMVRCVDIDNVRIEGLVLDGNRAGQTNGLPANTSHGVYADSVTSLTVVDVHCQETLDQAFKLRECRDLRIERCGCDGAGTEGWSLDNCQGGNLSDVYAKRVNGLDADGVTERPGGGSSWGFEIEDGTRRVAFNNVRCEDCTKGGGFHVQAHGDVYCGDLTVNNLIVSECPYIGFGFEGDDITLSNIVLRGSTMGMYISRGNLLLSNVLIDAGSFGIRMAGAVGRLIVNGGLITSGGIGIYGSGAVEWVAINALRIVAGNYGIQLRDEARLGVAMVNIAAGTEYDLADSVVAYKAAVVPI